MATQTAYPLQVLGKQSASFEAALAACLADPTVKGVHRLRTESRRLEAQVALLKALRGLPQFRPEAAKVLWQVKKLRQAAGRVRDLDVQAGHLEDHAARAREGSLPAEEKHKVVNGLERMLGKRVELRKRAAKDLVAEIRARQTKVAAALRKLSAVLEAASGRTWLGTELLAIGERQFARTAALKRQKPSDDDLHTVRKAAKQARYLAESAGSPKATAAGKRYEHLQELGGEWHDWLDLTAAARSELGRKHAVAKEFLALRKHALGKFQAELVNFTARAQPRTSGKKTGAS